MATTMIEKKVRPGNTIIEWTIIAVVIDGIVDAIKVLDESGSPFSWAFSDTVYANHVAMMQRHYDKEQNNDL